MIVYLISKKSIEGTVKLLLIREIRMSRRTISLDSLIKRLKHNELFITARFGLEGLRVVSLNP